MNGNIDQHFWESLNQEQKNDMVYKALVEINRKLSWRIKLFMTIAIIMGFVGGVFGHIGEGCFRWFGLIN